MSAPFCSLRSRSAAIHNRFEKLPGCQSPCSGCLCLPAALPPRKNTTISGTVYDPRLAAGMPNPLPLPNVLVYASTTPVTPPTSGAQCVTYANSIPTGANVVNYTYTAVDGTFTLQNIPQGATYTIVIQAGKWQRQFDEAVGTTALTGLQLGMPANHTQGNMPYIAIATGSVDGAECVLRDMGIADSEFTDDNQTLNAGGFVHLYRGSCVAWGGDQCVDPVGNAPDERYIDHGPERLRHGDVPVPGSRRRSGDRDRRDQSAELCGGGRAHFCYALQLCVARSRIGIRSTVRICRQLDASGEQQINSGVGTVQENFSDGIILADWLHDIGSTNPGTTNQINISTPAHRRGQRDCTLAIVGHAQQRYVFRPDGQSGDADDV